MSAERRLIEVLAAVNSFEPTDERGAGAKERTTRLLATAPEPFARDAGREHITASAVVVSSRGTLLHKHKRSGDWIGPGGHVDDDEWPAEAVVREVREETGLAVVHPEGVPQLIDLDVHETVNDHVHYDMRFVVLSDGSDPSPPEGESPDVLWFVLDEAYKMTDASHRSTLDAARPWLERVT